MAKIKTKKQLRQKWAAETRRIKEIYNQAKKHQKGLPRFEETDGYRYVKNKEKRSLKRWDNRKETNQKRREKYAVKKEIEKTNLNEYGDTMTVFEAFSGKGRVFEDAILKANEGKKFTGLIEVNYYGSKRHIAYTFTNYADFRIWINNFLSKLYNKDGDVYAAFRWTIDRFYFNDETTLTIKYIFTENEQSPMLPDNEEEDE